MDICVGSGSVCSWNNDFFNVKPDVFVLYVEKLVRTVEAVVACQLFLLFCSAFLRLNSQGSLELALLHTYCAAWWAVAKWLRVIESSFGSIVELHLYIENVCCLRSTFELIVVENYKVSVRHWFIGKLLYSICIESLISVRGSRKNNPESTAWRSLKPDSFFFVVHGKIHF